MQQHVEGLVFKNKVRGLHDLADGHILAPVIHAAAKGAAFYHAHDVFVVVAVHRYAAEVPCARVGVGLLYGELVRKLKHHGARGHNFAHAFLVERQHVADKGFFIGFDAPRLARKAGDSADVVF